MDSVKLTQALGYAVGDRLVVSAEAFDVRVAGLTSRRLLVGWPWLEVDPDSDNSWDGTIGFSRDADAYDWCNTPWRIEPDPSELEIGDACFVGIPPTEVVVTGIEKYEPPADFGFLPRPEYVLEVVPVSSLDDEDAGYVIYLGSAEPIEIEVIEGGQ